MRTKLIALLAFAGLFVTALSADVVTTLPSENVRAHSGKIFGNLSDLMAKTTQPIPVIVVLNAPATTGAVNRLQGLAGGFPVSYVYNVIPGFAAALTSGQIAALARDATVHQVEYDAEVHADVGTANVWFGTEKARFDFGVDGDMDADATNYTKDDVVIVILDTGVDPEHMDLDGGKVIAWKDFVNNEPGPYDDHGHGTHCASIAAGSGHGDPMYKGVAPGAALVGVKVMNSSGMGATSTIIAGINWVVANKATYGIRVLSISLSGGGNSDGQDALSTACNNAVDAGIVVCVSAGNRGPQEHTVASPCAAAKPITVGAMSDCGEDGFFLANFSSRGPTLDHRVKPDICAPGVRINAAKAGTTNEYTIKSGTSMSTPFVAGTVALMLDANPDLTPDEIKSGLKYTAQDWGPTSDEIDYGAGRLQGYDAVKLADGNPTGTGPIVPEHVYRSGNLTSRKNATDKWTVNVNSIDYPIAVTMVTPDWSTDQNFDLYLNGPKGLKRSSRSNTREEYIGYTPTRTGTYTISVKKVKGSGDYWFDLSCANAGSIIQIQDQYSVHPGDEGVMAEKTVPLSGVTVTRQADGGLAFSYDLAAAGNVTLATYDGTGRLVTTATLAGKPGSNYAELSTTGIAGGIYFYRLESGSASTVGKFAVIR